MGQRDGMTQIKRLNGLLSRYPTWIFVAYRTLRDLVHFDPPDVQTKAARVEI
jgi:hypothetical protein